MITETGWNEDGNCVKCGEAGRCHCNNHFVVGHGIKNVRIRRVPFTSDMFKRYSKDKHEIFHATGNHGRLNAVGTLSWIIELAQSQKQYA